MKKIVSVTALLISSIVFSQQYDYVSPNLPRLDHADNFFEFDGERFPEDFPQTLALAKKSVQGRLSFKETVEDKHIILKMYYDERIMFCSQSFNKKGIADGPAKLYYGDGQVRQDIPFVKGKALGIGRAYDKDGMLLIETTYKDNKRDGARRVFSRRGDITIEGSFANDMVTERIKVTERKAGVYYYPPDMKKGVVEYFAGTIKLADIPIIDTEVVHGAFTEYFPNGITDRIINYSNGRREGTSQYFKYDGSLLFSNDYHNDNAVGVYKFVERDGVVLQEGHYKQGGLKTGLWISRNSKGGLEKEEHYNDKGQLDGMYKDYFNDSLTEETPYVNGKKEGLSKSYDSKTGRVTAERTYKNDRQILYKGYYENGKLFTETQYKGEKLVSSVYYQPDGKILCTNRYNDKGMPVGVFKNVSQRDNQYSINTETHYDETGAKTKSVVYGYVAGSYTESYYRKDKLHGPQTVYNSKTNEKKVTYFFDGKTVTEKEFTELSKKQKP